MNKIKVSILGSDGYVCQIPRIKEGIKELGHILSDESPDLIYSNDPRGYEKALQLKRKYPKAYLILNFLDIPWHMPNIQKQTELLVKNFFLKADVITAISFKVKKDIGKFYDKKVHVIYNPIKDVYFDENIKKNILSNSTFAIAKSGTISLEICNAGVPSIIIYKMNFLNFFIIKLLIKVRYANIFNIISNSEIIPELLQSRCNPKTIYEFVESYIKNPKLGKTQILNCNKILDEMKIDTSSTEKVANILNKSLN